MNNYKKYYISHILYSIGYLICTGSIIQTYLIKAGFSEHQVYLYNSLIQLAQIIMMVIMIFVADRIKRVKHAVAIGQLSLIPATIVFVIGTINPSLEKNPFIISVFITSILSFFGYGFQTILSYKLPYKIIDIKSYGKLLGTNALISGPVVFGISILHAVLVSKLDYNQIMMWFFILTIICFLLSAIVSFSYKEIESESVQKNEKNYSSVLKNKNTYILLIPNFTRGIASGIVGLITVIAISKGIVDTNDSSMINVAIKISAIISYVFYLLLIKRMKSSNILLISSFLFCAVLPFSLLFDYYTFLILLVLFYIGISIIDTIIPVIVTEIIPESEISAFTSVRMLVHTFGSMVAGLIIIPIVSIVGYTGLLVFASIMQMICIITYYFVSRLSSKKKEKNDILMEY